MTAFTASDGRSSQRRWKTVELLCEGLTVFWGTGSTGFVSSTDLALLRRLRKKLSGLMLDGLTATLRTMQMSSLMLRDVFDMLENLSAFDATVLVGRHDASPTGSSPTGPASFRSRGQSIAHRGHMFADCIDRSF